MRQRNALRMGQLALVVGGALLIVGAFQAWIPPDSGSSVSPRGQITASVGSAMVVAGLLFASRRLRHGVAKPLALLMAVGPAIILCFLWFVADALVPTHAIGAYLSALGTSIGCVGALSVFVIEQRRSSTTDDSNVTF